MRSAPPQGPAPASTGSPRTRHASTVDGDARGGRERRGRVAGQALPRASPTTTSSSAPRGGTCARPETWSSTWPLIGVIIGVAVGHLFGWKGDVIVPVGKTFANTLSPYDTFSPGPLVDPTSCRRSRSRSTSSTPRSRRQVRAAASSARPATSRRTSRPRDAGCPAEKRRSGQPPARDGRRRGLPARQRVRAGGHRPRRRGRGALQRRHAVPAQDNNYTSVGAVKVPGAAAQAARLPGLFLPTADLDKDTARARSSPTRSNPELALTVFEGDLFPGGRPQSVYTLDTAEMTQLQGRQGDPLRIRLQPGQTYQLPGGRGRSPSTGSSGSPGCRSGTTRARSSPWSPRCSRSPGSWPRWSSGGDGSSCGFLPRPSRAVPWSPSAAWPRATTKGWTVIDGSPPPANDEGTTPMTDETLAELRQPRDVLRDGGVHARDAGLRRLPRRRCCRPVTAPRTAPGPRARAGAVGAGAGSGRRRRDRRPRRPPGASASRARKAGGIAWTSPCSAASCSSCRSCCAGSRCTAGRWATCTSSRSSARCSPCWPTRLGDAGATCGGSACSSSRRCCSSSGWPSPSGTPRPPS